MADFIRRRVRGYSLNVCAGKSTIGDVRVDLEPQAEGIIKADMRNLPFEDGSNRGSWYSLVFGYYLHSAYRRFYVSGGDYGLFQPVCAELVGLEQS